MDEVDQSGGGRRLPRWVLPATAGALIATVATVLLVVRTLDSACAAGLASVQAEFASVDGVVADGPVLVPVAAPEARSGKATHYDADGGGNCSFEAAGPGMYVALSPSEYADGAACGEHLDVTNARGTVRVKVTDQCPECPAGHVDLSKEAFVKLGALATGVLAVTYRRVDNPKLPGPLSVRIKDGASRYWFAARIDNHGNQLSAVEVKTGSSWVKLTRTDYNYWVQANGAGSGPFTLRITDIAGHVVTTSGVTLSPERVQRTAVWMYGGPGASPATSASQSASAAAVSPAASVDIAASASGGTATDGGKWPAPSASPSRHPCT